MLECVQARIAPSSIFECPGFDLAYIALDSMHCGDLGVFQDAAAADADADAAACCCCCLLLVLLLLAAACCCLCFPGCHWRVALLGNGQQELAQVLCHGCDLVERTAEEFL